MNNMNMEQVPDPRQAPALRWGILGPGGIARRFAREIPAHTASRIVAVGSRDLGRAQRFVAENLPDQGVRAYGSYEELVADPVIDAVYVSSPHSEHSRHAILALEAGKPVLVEKAFALNAGQAEQVFSVAARQHLFVMEAMWSRFLPHYAAIHRLVRSGELGQVRAITAVHAQALDLDPAKRMMNPALGGGALLDLGIYPLSLFHFLCGVPDRIIATGVRTSTGVDLRETITCQYGDTLAVALDDMEVAAKCGVQIVGTEGRLEIDDWFYTPRQVTFTADGGTPYVVIGPVEGGFQFEAAEAARCIAAGLAESPLMTWQATKEVLGMADEVRRQLTVVYPGEQAGVQ